MANDITIQVGAKDAASTSLKRIEKNVDNVGKASVKTGRMGRRAMEGFAGGLKAAAAAAGPLLAVFGAFKAVQGLTGLVTGSSEAFDVQAESVRSLTVAMRQNGEVSDATIQSQLDFTSALQDATNVGDEVTLGLMKQASMLGVNNEDLQQTTQAALGLSEALGISLEDALRKTVNATEGNAGALAEYIPAVRNATTEQEKLAAVLGTAERGFQQLQDKTNTAEGSATKLSNTWGDFLEVIGEAIAPLREAGNTMLTELVLVIQNAVIPAMQSIMPTADQIASVVKRASNAITFSIAVIQTGWQNLGKVWENITLRMGLSLVRFVEDTKHFLTVEIPEYAKWFARNFVNLLTDAFNIVVTAFSNAMKNIAGAFTALWQWVKDGMSGGVTELFRRIGEEAGRGLLDGFEAQTERLPQIAQRQLTGTERILKQQIDRNNKQIAEAFQKNLAALRGRGKVPGLPILNLQQRLGAGEGLINELGQKGLAGGQQAQATLQSKESRLLTRGSVRDPQLEILEWLKRIGKSNEKIEENTEKSPGEQDPGTVLVIG